MILVGAIGLLIDGFAERREVPYTQMIELIAEEHGGPARDRIRSFWFTRRRLVQSMMPFDAESQDTFSLGTELRIGPINRKMIDD